jgi:hypothetical protein
VAGAVGDIAKTGKDAGDAYQNLEKLVGTLSDLAESDFSTMNTLLDELCDNLYVITLYTPTLKDTKKYMDDLSKVRLNDMTKSVEDATKKIESLKSTTDTDMAAIEKVISDKMKTASQDVTSYMGEIETTFSTKFSSVLTNVTNTFTTIASTIADKMKSASTDLSMKLGEIEATVLSKMTSISSTFSSEAGKWSNTIREAINAVKDQFSGGFDWGIPELKIPVKVPKFKQSGKWGFDSEGNITATPSISVEWYRRAAQMGALFTEPQIIGVGDASQPEMLIGEETLYNSIRRAVMDSNGGGFQQTNNFTMAEGYSPIEAARLIRNNTRQVLTRMRGGV